MNGARNEDSLMRPILIAACSTAVVMTTFEVLKQILHPAITVWRSHIITIIFTTTVSVVVTFLALRKYRSVRNAADMEMLRLNAELKFMNEELQAFNYTVAHDLRQPLSIVSTYCQAVNLQFGATLDRECKDYIDQAYKCTLRMNGMIEALLNFARMGQVEPRRETVDLSALADDIAASLKLSDPARQVEFRIEDGMIARGQESLLRVVLDNLLGNAWKYTRLREKAIIEFGIEDVGGEQRYFVRDNGMGFDTKEAETIFTPFVRLADAEEQRGFGIGLATVQRIIHRHGGMIWAEGKSGEGATFFFTLPKQGAGN